MRIAQEKARAQNVLTQAEARFFQQRVRRSSPFTVPGVCRGEEHASEPVLGYSDAAAFANVVSPRKQSPAETSLRLLEFEQQFHRLQDALVSRIASLESELASLRSVSEVPLDPTAEWVAANSSQLEQYRGKQVAIHPGRGIVASGATFAEVYDLVREQGLLEQVVFDAVPDA